jgi:hypothetical protein
MHTLDTVRSNHKWYEDGNDTKYRSGIELWKDLETEDRRC